jgi:Leucine-rich repeat (LRR) protein
VENIEPLAQLRFLRRIDLRDNNLSRIAPLARHTGLTHLNIAGNQITDADTLEFAIQTRGLKVFGMDAQG